MILRQGSTLNFTSNNFHLKDSNSLENLRISYSRRPFQVLKQSSSEKILLWPELRYDQNSDLTESEFIFDGEFSYTDC